MPAIEDLLSSNQREATAFAKVAMPRLCIVACDDAALTVQLDATLGIVPGGASVIRLPAGAGALSEEVLQRAVAKAVYVEGCDEVLLLTHSSCTLYSLQANDLID